MQRMTQRRLQLYIQLTDSSRCNQSKGAIEATQVVCAVLLEGRLSQSLTVQVLPFTELPSCFELRIL